MKLKKKAQNFPSNLIFDPINFSLLFHFESLSKSLVKLCLLQSFSAHLQLRKKLGGALGATFMPCGDIKMIAK